VSFGYDVSGIHSGFFVTASINDGEENATKSMLSKVESLKIPVINQLIASIGTDVSGMFESYEERLKEALSAYLISPKSQSVKNTLIRLCRANTEDSLLDLDVFLSLFKTAMVIGDPKDAYRMLKKYIKSNRLRLLDLTKSVVTGIRKLVMSGVLVNGEAVTVFFTRIPVSRGTSDEFNSAYYKRDIDSIRKARMKVYKSLGKKYVPPTYED